MRREQLPKTPPPSTAAVVAAAPSEAVGAINRVPSEGETRSNMHAGGRPEKVGLTARDREMRRQRR